MKSIKKKKKKPDWLDNTEGLLVLPIFLVGVAPSDKQALPAAPSVSALHVPPSLEHTGCPTNRPDLSAGSQLLLAPHMCSWAQAHRTASPSLFITPTLASRERSLSLYMEAPEVPDLCLTPRRRPVEPGRTLGAESAPRVVGKRNAPDKPLSLWAPVPMGGGS